MVGSLRAIGRLTTTLGRPGVADVHAEVVAVLLRHEATARLCCALAIPTEYLLPILLLLPAPREHSTLDAVGEDV